MPLGVVLFRLFLSSLLGAIVGVEREIHKRAAGFRTHILVCIGSTLFMLTSVSVAFSYSGAGDADPSRIAAGVVTGIGFLGAGAIIRYGESIKGLTTAASVWVVASIGLSVGAGMYWAAVATTGIVLAVLVLSRLEEQFERKTGKTGFEARKDEKAYDPEKE
jgi:putative Mg2+ transporter-C (MgtC) family protein